MGKLYDVDIVAWSCEQAELLRAGRWDALDRERIAEEIEDVGKSEMRELDSRVAVLIAHLLKWKFQPQLRSTSWRATVKLQRKRVARRLARTPSLQRFVHEATWLEDVWDDALALASADTGVDTLPAQPIWDIDAIVDPDFLPD